jgi:hypothetical protein
MKHKNKTSVAISTAKDALALVASTAEKIVVRSANSERGIKAKYASFHDGVALGMSGRILSQKKYEEVFGKRMTPEALTASYEAIQGRMNTLGIEALDRQSKAVQDGKRKVTRIFANLSNGRTIVETITTNKMVDIEAVVEETKLNGKACVSAEQAQAIARNLARYKLA